jgi:hypothetical protein
LPCWRVCAVPAGRLWRLPHLLPLIRPTSVARGFGSWWASVKAAPGSSSSAVATARASLPVAPVHLAGRGGEKVAWCLPWLARSSGGFIWELLEFRLSTALPPRQRFPATAICGHRDGRDVLVAFDCESSLLLVRSFCPASAASKPPVQPSGFVPAWNWGGAATARPAISGKHDLDCLLAILVRGLVVIVRDYVVIFSFSEPLCKIPTAE